MLNRKISIFSTTRDILVLENSDLITWDQLRNTLINDHKYDLSNLVASESYTKTTLESSEAVLPVGDFVLFLRPKETKAGVKSREELKEVIKDENNEFKIFLKAKNVSWTNTSTERLNELLEEFNKLNQEEDEDDNEVKEVDKDSIFIEIDNIIDSLENLRTLISQLPEEEVQNEVGKVKEAYEKFLRTL